MPSVRKLVRDGMYARLSADTVGFNSFYAIAAAAYGNIPGMEINWTQDSKQFFQGYLTPDATEASQLTSFASIALYTSEADGTANVRREKSRKFSGTIKAHLDFTWKFRPVEGKGGIERNDTESISDAIEDAILECFHVENWPSGVAYNGDYSCARDPLILYGDGFGQRIPMIFIFEVHV